MTRTLLAALVAIALLAAPAIADPLTEADKRCFDNMAFGDNSLFCMVPPEPNMTVAEYLAHINFMSREVITIEALEEFNRLPPGTLVPEALAPETMLALPPTTATDNGG